ncbi:hypothetical protein EES42_41610 [Streptomyces sp. ADI95-17]|nr:hypothetical protein EES42_41610 [Streptomyces sp. ADI95-17]
MGREWVRGSVGIERVARAAGFLALRDLEAQRKNDGEVGAERTVVLGKEGRAAVRAGTAGQGRPEGFASVWVTDGRAWTQDSYQPTHGVEGAALLRGFREAGSPRLRQDQRYSCRLQSTFYTSALFSIRRCEESRRF